MPVKERGEGEGEGETTPSGHAYISGRYGPQGSRGDSIGSNIF